MESKLIPCNRCGSTQGYYSVFKGSKFYDACGNDAGYVTEGAESKTVKCIECGRRLSRLKLTESRRSADDHK